MSEYEEKVIAFLLGVVYKLSIGQDLNFGEVQQLDNLMGEFGTYDLDENEFRY